MDLEQLELLINEILSNNNNNKINSIMDLIVEYVNELEDIRI
tara:strand:- start:177 stop:302 length:126 start_codon:yes stop_codon:yes gene_type:complete